MGCDIHAILQVRSGDKWETPPNGVNITNVRDYNLFSVLANVRNGVDLPFIAEPRGVPDDLQCNDDFDVHCPCGANYPTVWIGDHSHSWVTLAEIEAMVSTLAELPPSENARIACAGLQRLLEAINWRRGEWWQWQSSVSDDKIRLVFGFDS